MRDATTDKPSVAVLGAGRMGLPIIGHLVAKGFDVRVYDVDPERAAATPGARASTSPVEAVTDARVVLVCVGFEDELVALVEGPAGLLDAMPADSVLAVLSTVSPAVMVRLAEAGVLVNVHVIDAPVCRGSWAADAGQLLTLVGGDRRAADAFEPVARAYSSDIVHLGGIGSGQVGKAVNNLILWACLVADHEGLALAQRYGVDIDLLREALAMSSANNHALGNWNNQTMKWAEDDMRIVQEMATAVGIGLPQAGVNREVCRALKPRRYDLAQYGR